MMPCPAMRRSGLRLAALLAAAALLPPAALAEPARYAIDPVHTRVVFSLSHAGYSQAIGTVSGSTGSLVFDPDDWGSARLQVEVPLARLDLGDEKWNAAALGRGLLDGKDHPVASFVSTRIEALDATHASVYGILTLRGVARQVKLDVTLNQVKRYPLPPFRHVAGFSATATIDRRDFGIDAWSNRVIGDRVELRIEAEATREDGPPIPAQAPIEPTSPPVVDDIPPASAPAGSGTPEDTPPASVEPVEQVTP